MWGKDLLMSHWCMCFCVSFALVGLLKILCVGMRFNNIIFCFMFTIFEKILICCSILRRHWTVQQQKCPHECLPKIILFVYIDHPHWISMFSKVSSHWVSHTRPLTVAEAISTAGRTNVCKRIVHGNLQYIYMFGATCFCRKKNMPGYNHKKTAKYGFAFSEHLNSHPGPTCETAVTLVLAYNTSVQIGLWALMLGTQDSIFFFSFLFNTLLISNYLGKATAAARAALLSATSACCGFFDWHSAFLCFASSCI